MTKRKRQPDRRKGVLLRFPTDVEESLELFAQEKKVSVTYVVRQMFEHGFEKWRAGEFNVPVDAVAEHFGRVSVKMKETFLKMKEARERQC